ncbi:MAG: lamin tail domain-containing protein [Candidatus Nanoarchaeia archaeon]
MHWSLIFAILLLVNSAAAIQISELMYDPACKEPDGEWLELYNNDSSAINLTGWKIFESGYNRNLILIDGTFLLEPNDYIIVAKNATFFKINFPNYSKSLLQSTFSFSNSGELVQLIDADGNVVDSVNYNSSWGANNNNNSLQRIDKTKAFTFENSCESVPTPGSSNSCELKKEEPSPESSSENESQEQQFDLKLEVKIQNATQGMEVKNLFKLTNLDYKSDQPEISATVDFEAKLNGTIEFTSSFTVTFKQSKSVGTGAWMPEQAGVYTLCGKITNATFSDPDSSNNVACAEIKVAANEQQEQITPTNQSQSKITKDLNQTTKTSNLISGSASEAKNTWHASDTRLSIGFWIFAAVLLFLIGVLLWALLSKPKQPKQPTSNEG